LSLVFLRDFLLKERLLTISTIGFILSTLYTQNFPTYSNSQLEVIFILFMLFISVNGMQRGRALEAIAKYIERGEFISLKLILTTFFLSMFVTNDISLIVIVPITLSLNIDRKDILVILEALSANVGSALSPIGNPQNLFIYWHYNLSIFEFIETIAPFSIVFLLILIAISIYFNSKNGIEEEYIEIEKISFIYLSILVVIIFAILHILPLYFASIAFIFALIFDRKALYIDYSLLFIFLLFFGMANNLETLLNLKIEYQTHIFIFSALISQILSNVPTALIFSKFTSNWEALLWGVNVGGFGTLFSSLANLIAYRIYIKSKRVDIFKFTFLFHIFGLIFFIIGVLLYFIFG